MTANHAEIKDIGRFIRARRMDTIASDSTDALRRRRRVPHLTQDDLADRIGVSTAVVSQIEQGRYPNLSEGLLARIANILSFSAQQEMYAFGLLNERPTRQNNEVVPPQWLVTSIEDSMHPVVLLSPAYDMLAWNDAFAKMFGNLASSIFSRTNALFPVLELPEIKTFFEDWEEYRNSMISGLRMSYAVHADLRDYILELAMELASRSDYFRERWNADNPLVVPELIKPINHPSLGRLNMAQITTFVVESPQVLKVEYLPADGETRKKFDQLT